MNIPFPQKSKQTNQPTSPPPSNKSVQRTQTTQQLAGSQTSAVRDTNIAQMCLGLEPSPWMQQTGYGVRETEGKIAATTLFGEKMSQNPQPTNQTKIQMKKKWLNILSYVRV